MPRRKTYRKRSGVFGTRGSDGPPSGSGTRESVMAAALIFLEAAKKNASRFSTRIAPATAVYPVDENRAVIHTDGAAAPNAAAFEFGQRHPVFGNPDVWVKQPTRAYMQNAAKNKGALEKAGEEYGTRETELLAKEYGYTE